MFEHDQGLGPGKWLKWFTAAMAIFAITTFWPGNRTLAFIGSICATAGISLARHQIKKGRE